MFIFRENRVSSNACIKYGSPLIVILLSIIVFLPLAGCVSKTAKFGRVNRIGWYLTVAEKDGETLHDVNIYVPFPREDGKPFPHLLSKLEAQTQRYYPKSDGPNIDYSVVNTKFGEMLKVSISKMYRSTESIGGGLNLRGEYWYATALPIGKADMTYPLEPVIADGQKEEAPFYIEYEGGTGIYVWLVYSAGTSDMYLPVLPTTVGKTWVTGQSMTTSKNGHPSVSENDRILIERQGWSLVPVWTSERLMLL